MKLAVRQLDTSYAQVLVSATEGFVQRGASWWRAIRSYDATVCGGGKAWLGADAVVALPTYSLAHVIKGRALLSQLQIGAT